MKIEKIELIRVELGLVQPFRTSFGTQFGRDILLVHVLADCGSGWGECVALSSPSYSSEFVEGAAIVIREYLAPRILGQGDVTAAELEERWASVRGHQMAKGAVEMAILDAELRASGLSFSRFLGGVRDRVTVGVSVGIAETIEELVGRVRGYVSEGYGRIKLKIEPGWDIEPVRAVRAAVGDDILLQVDGNAAYPGSSGRTLAALDDFNLLLIEQPFAADDLEAHAKFARQVETPVCLDESVESAADAFRAIELGACSVVNVKAGRVGGYLEARRVHDVCRAAGVPVWCGGMLETGIGRAANLALASLPGFVLPADISASRRYYERDITSSFELEDSCLKVPAGAGLGVDVDDRLLADLGASRSALGSGA